MERLSGLLSERVPVHACMRAEKTACLHTQTIPHAVLSLSYISYILIGLRAYRPPRARDSLNKWTDRSKEQQALYSHSDDSFVCRRTENEAALEKNLIVFGARLENKSCSSGKSLNSGLFQFFNFFRKNFKKALTSSQSQRYDSKAPFGERKERTLKIE